jgi:hypothetical protein
MLGRVIFPLRVTWLLVAVPAAVNAAAPVDFNREVRPILSDKCFHCHGPDEEGRKGKLRLDTREGATRVRNDVAPIVPGRSAESEMVFRIISTDTEEMMPPPDSKLGRLSAAEVETLKRWIDEGAAYQSHWAFSPVAAGPPPAIPAPLPAGVSVRNPIDRYLLAGLAAKQRAPQPEADPVTLIRRVTFDLTGLPPTPAEVAAYAADRDPQAYDRLVDRLLQSPRYGERMAVDWLDVARYADSYGFQVDRERDMWPWRDWVIKAFNQNLPWDQFVTWQLAGDLLPNATPEQRLATGFNRLHPQESEGGSVEEEYRVNYINDRVTTFGTAFLGLTLECARCHDHKFDPITQKDFYRFFAFFDDIDEAGLYSFFTKAVPTPAMRVPDDALDAKISAATQAADAAAFRLQDLRKERRAAFEAWVARQNPLEVRPGGEVAQFDFDQREETPKPSPKAKSKAGAPAPAATESEPPALPVRFASRLASGQYASTAADNASVPGRAGLALKLTGDHPVNTKVGNFARHQPFSVSLWLQTPDVKERAVVMHRSRAWTDAGSRGYELLIEEGRLKWSLIHFWPGDAISIRAQRPLPVNEWVHVSVTNDGSSRAAGLQIFVNGEAVTTDVIRDHLTKDITGGGGDSIALGERFRDKGFRGGLVDELRVFERALTALEAKEVFTAGSADALVRRIENAAGDGRAPTRDLLLDYYLSNHDEPFRAQLAALQAARAEVTKLADSAMEVMVMQELPQPKPAYVLKRGEYDQRGEAVEAGTPEFLPPFPAGAPRNRLGLAQWLTEARHPLLARVTVNRLWQSLFGLGLVKTTEDFGSQADRAEYPALLDWLAEEFVRSGWDVKGLLRTIVTSHTYRQRSFGGDELMAEDPENRLLARGPRYRFPAEMIRDHALAVSGLLVEKVGGPPVFTYDLPESFKPAPAGKGEQLYRRSLYTFWRRNGPAPMLEAFDVPNRVVCVVKRDTTNTPLHAFVLLNGPQFVEAARVLAESLHRAGAGRREAIAGAAHLRLLGRAASDAELAILTRLYDEQLAWYRSRPDEAEAYLKIGDTARDAALPAPEIAATTTLVNTLMNHDGFVVKR